MARVKCSNAGTTGMPECVESTRVDTQMRVPSLYITKSCTDLKVEQRVLDKITLVQTVIDLRG